MRSELNDIPECDLFVSIEYLKSSRCTQPADEGGSVSRGAPGRSGSDHGLDLNRHLGRDPKAHSDLIQPEKRAQSINGVN
jgi:hypothetical protein